MLPEVPFGEGLSLVDLDDDGLFLEGFSTVGTSNYPANLNFRGLTWAGALRMPAKGAAVADFLKDKRRALLAGDYLSTTLGDGIGLRNGNRLAFAGASCVTEGLSTQSFLKRNRGAVALTLVDRIGGRKKVFRSFKYPESLSFDVAEYITDYSGPFYLSRGAPAWETLEDLPDAIDVAAEALAHLHVRSGVGSPVPIVTARRVLQELGQLLSRMSESWAPSPSSKEQSGLARALSKWGAETDGKRRALVRRERLLRSETGRKAVEEFLSVSLGRRGGRWLESFCHGDCHAGNFIVVRYKYDWNTPGMSTDRMFLNEIFEADQNLVEVEVDLDVGGRKVTYRHRSRPEADSGAGLVARRNAHDDVYLIDLDNGTGVTDDEKVLHLLDACVLAISAANVRELYGVGDERAEAVLELYYEALVEARG